MFRKILIANRGEIACRIIRTARRMGIGTVAVYSDADARSPHVRLADEAVPIGPAPATQSYLSIEAILAAARATDADAVHPGYGFLSERADFARALAESGIAFVGPHAGAIEAMGDKIASKRAAAAAGVSTVPGFLGVVEDAAHAVRIAEEVGFPVMLKASAGGGGKGMRIARTAAEVAEGLARARSEAGSSFGDDRVFIERYIEDARHVEIQVLGDKYGDVVHLGERECSIQRRNQKIVEECPSPLLDAETRAAMGAQAVALARAVGYDSAGTVEFVAGQDRSFFFLEMNTRLQVEHPVTELVTGLDLVEEMIRIAAGEPLRVRQDGVRRQGWAVESRVYAEDPGAGFLPSSGRIVRYREPPAGSAGDATVRVDSGVEEGSEVALHYDPMLAKLVTHAPTREAAIAAQAAALDAFAIEGIRTNVAFLGALMRHPRFRAGRLSTAFLAEEFPNGFEPGPPDEAAAASFACVAAAIDALLERRRRRGRPTSTPERRARIVRLGPRDMRCETEPAADGGFVVRVDGTDHRPRSDWRPGEPVWTGTLDDCRIAVQVRPVLNGYRMAHAGSAAEVFVYGEREAEFAARMKERGGGAADRRIRSPMPALVVSILVEAGATVEEGEPVAVLEAMKMETVVRAPHAGTITTLHARAGEMLAVGAPILEFA